MNDRYLFRGKINTDYEGGICSDWIIGFYRENDYGESFIEELGGDSLCVTPSTVGQCTGLRDKNGTLIFEGDVINWLTSDNELRKNFVTWTNNYCLSLCNSAYSIGMYAGNVLEIIGNIHDTTELMEGNDENLRDV